VVLNLTLEGRIAGTAAINGLVTNQFGVVPEPASLAPVALGLSVLAVRHRRSPSADVPASPMAPVPRAPK